MKALAGLVLTALAPPAAAEVCDKERPLWNPAGGPATALDEVLHFFALTPLGWLIALLAVAALALRRRWMSGLAALATACSLALLLAAPYLDTGEFGQIREAAAREGCLGSPLLLFATLSALTGTLLWHARHGAKLKP